MTLREQLEKALANAGNPDRISDGDEAWDALHAGLRPLIEAMVACVSQLQAYKCSDRYTLEPCECGDCQALAAFDRLMEGLGEESRG